MTLTSERSDNFRNLNNIINIGDNVKFYNLAGYGNIRAEGNDVKITIGNDTSIQSARINVQENGSCLVIGNDCMISNEVILRVSDSHPIYDMLTKERINPAKNVCIGNHVWIAQKATVMKGVTVGDGAVIGLGSIVTHDIPPNCIASGIPAKILKQGIRWDKHFLNHK